MKPVDKIYGAKEKERLKSLWTALRNIYSITFCLASSKHVSRTMIPNYMRCNLYEFKVFKRTAIGQIVWRNG
jgi:hypothetical protein